MIAGSPPGSWSWRHVVVLAAALAAGVLARLAVLPATGLRGDIDQFVVWTHGIAVNGLGNAYDQNLSFPPVMAYVWGTLAALEPVFRTATDSSDLHIRVLMKLPATIADFGLAAAMAWAFRARPRWAVVAAAIVLLHPAVIDVSAWWGQYESVYLLVAVVAVLLALGGRTVLAAAAIAVCLMTKPQALAFILPFAAWFWAHGGWRELARATIVGFVVIAVLWSPFLAAGGPLNYLGHLAAYQNETFAVLSLRAWNIWWLAQVAAVGGFASDTIPVVGPITLRHIGFVVTGALSLLVAAAIVRDPRPRTFILGLITTTLIWFGFLTQMHERYAYGAMIFLLLLIPERRIRWLSLAFGIVFTLDLLTAAPPAPVFEAWLPPTGVQTTLGAVAMIVITVVAFVWLRTDGGTVESGPDHRVAAAGQRG